MSWERYVEAERKLNEGLIRLELSLDSKKSGLGDTSARMAEMKSFLGDCGDPQIGIPAVHVAGTSGKGSVAAAVAGILTETGLKVGLHVSPYLQSATEKIWIDGSFVSSDRFADLVDWVMPKALCRLRPETPASIHGMASVAIVLEAFRSEKVDIAVVEAGCGGRFDLTSFVDTVVAVVTNVGMDHVQILGPTLENIAWHKAGVARPVTPLVTGANGTPLDIIRREADEVGAPLFAIASEGDALEHNRAIARTTARFAADALGISLDPTSCERGADRIKLAGRCEAMPSDGATVFLDCAHNPDKLNVAVRSALAREIPRPVVALVGFLDNRGGPEMISPFSGRFDAVVATNPRVYGKPSFPAEKTAALFASAGYSPICEPDPFTALDKALAEAGKTGTVLATGSCYLVGELRGRWYQKEQVVLKRTSWPYSLKTTEEK